MAPPIVNARNLRNGWGVNAPPSSQAVTAMNFIGTRWIRMQFDGDISGLINTFKNQWISAGGFDPNPKVQLLLNDYLGNAGTNTFNNQAGWIVNNCLPIKNANGKSTVAAIEGPNEMNSFDGGGARGPNNSTDLTGGGNVTSDNPTANANFVDWSTQLSNLRNANSAAFAGIEILSPTILYFFANNWSTALNVTGKVDYGTFHYYAGVNGTSGVPSFPPNPDNFAAMYGFAKAGIGPSLSFVQSESGVSSQTGGGYGQDGRSSCRYLIMQMLDHFAVGGHRVMIYNLFNNSIATPGNVTNFNEDNFGIYYGDLSTPKPSATALHNFANLMSLGNSYSNAANLTDTATFTPSYTGAGLTVTGLTTPGAAGSLLVMPKSDGSTMIAVWNEPPIDSGSGTSTSVSANNITVNFGSTQTYKVYDCMGGGNVNNFTVSTNAVSAPIATGTGSSVALTLFGNPLFIEFPGAAPPATVPSQVTVTTGASSSTEQTLNWTTATQSPTDYIITVTEIT